MFEVLSIRKLFLIPGWGITK